MQKKPRGAHVWSFTTENLPTYTITASAGANGGISPSGSVMVIQGSNQSFTITPDSGYQVLDILVDGVSAGTGTNHTFSNVTTAHTIAAIFSAANTPSLICTDSGIPCVSRTDGGSDSDNLADKGAGIFVPAPDKDFAFTVTVKDPTGATPQYVRLYLAQKTTPAVSDFYMTPLTCGGNYATGAICSSTMQLGPAAVHKFYFEAKMNDGMIITYPASGYITGPQVQLLHGSSMIGVARDVRTSMLDGTGAFGINAIYRWVSTGLTTDSNKGAYELVDSVHPQVKPGEGYVIKNPEDPMLPELAASAEIADPSYTITLSPGWNMISNPYNGGVPLSAVQVRKDSGTATTWLAAAGSKWVTNALYAYNGSDWGGTYSFESAGGPTEATLVPWVGYWVYLNKADGIYTMIIPKP